MANEVKKYLDKAGLQVLWEQAKIKFIDNTELTDALANYTTLDKLAEELAKYYTKTEIDAFFDEVEAKITAEETRAKGIEAKKVDKEIQGTNGKAIIFNEADGGGAKFEHSDGTWSFAGVNDGGADGLAAQVYAVDSNNGYKGTKLDVTKGGLYYTKGETSGLPVAQRDVEDNEVAVKGDIAEYTIVKDADPGEYASVYHLTKDGTNVGAAIEIAKDQLLKSVTVKTCTEEGVPIAGLHVGDKYIDFEFETTSGTTHSYIAVKDMVTPYTAGDGIAISDANVISVSAIGIEKVTGLQTALDAKADQSALNAEITRATAAEATKTTQEVTNANGKSLIMNEADGGGVFFIKDDNTRKSFVGVNDSTAGGPDAQIYAIDPSNSNYGAKLDVLKDGIYYTVGSDSYASRVVEANKLATIGNVTPKLDKLPNVDDPEDPGYGFPYHIPYDVAVTPSASTIDLTLKTLTLDGNVTKMNFDKSIPAATASTAGLMVATDKDKLDNIDTMTQAEIEAICQ